MTLDLCQFSDIFGKPGQGVHSLRLGGFAVVDIAFTVIGALVLSHLFDWSFWLTLLGLFVLGIVMHQLFCVKTKLNTLLFQ
jgi:energy-converting hydrogenase Eha subunit H